MNWITYEPGHWDKLPPKTLLIRIENDLADYDLSFNIDHIKAMTFRNIFPRLLESNMIEGVNQFLSHDFPFDRFTLIVVGAL